MPAGLLAHESHKLQCLLARQEEAHREYSGPTAKAGLVALASLGKDLGHRPALGPILICPSVCRDEIKCGTCYDRGSNTIQRGGFRG